LPIAIKIAPRLSNIPGSATGHGWLLGDEVGAQPNLVFHCDLYWVDVNIASDVVEPTITRSQTTLILTYLCIFLKELFLHSE
jgi:hypothetical protein